MPLPPKPWPVGVAEEVEPLVRLVLAPNGSAWTYTGTQSFLVGDDRGLAVIDPGPDDPQHIAALLRAIGTAPVVAICCTHTHRDHSPAAAPLAAATGAPVIGCAPIRAAGDGAGSDAPFDTGYAPDRVLADGETLVGAGWALTAIATPGHASNHLCFALAEEGVDTGVVFTGDHVMGWATSVVAPPDGDMADYLASLEKLHDRDDRIYYPAHGPAVTRPRQLVRGMIGHRRQREMQILRLLATGPHDPAKLAAQMYRGLSPGLLGAARQSIMAHLIDLERRGLVIRSGSSWTHAP